MRPAPAHRLDLGAASDSPSRARQFVGSTFASLENGSLIARETLDVAVLLASELVTNAVVHGAGPISLEISSRPGAVRIEVGDASPEVPAVATATDQDTSGRGLALVQALAVAWGVDRVSGNGKRVWFEL